MASRFSISFILWMILCSSCSWLGSKKQNEQPVAKVYDHFLYPSDLVGVGKGAASAEDSMQAVRHYIDIWIRHNILLRYAEDNLSGTEEELDERLRDYKESLLIYSYENALLNEKLDTSVTTAQIQKYYDQNLESFALKSSIARVKFIILKSTPRVAMDSVRHWLKNPGDYNHPKLEGFARDHAVRYSVGDTVWYNKEELEALLPVSRFNLDNAQYNKSYLEVADSDFIYLIKFNDYRIKGSDAPVDFVKNEIASILINQRKIAFISSIHKSMFDEAEKNGEFEIYLNEEEP